MALIKAGFFWVQTDAGADKITDACRARADAEPKATKPFEASLDHHTYRLTGATWNQQTKIFSATMWLVRDLRLPRKLTGAADKQLNLRKDENLGEPASFAYEPAKSRALVEYNHNGPRYSAVRAFISKLGIEEVITLSPIEKTGVLARMKRAELIRKFEFALSGRDGIEQLRSAGVSVGNVIDTLNDLDGYTIRVIISMGHHRDL